MVYLKSLVHISSAQAEVEKKILLAIRYIRKTTKMGYMSPAADLSVRN